MKNNISKRLISTKLHEMILNEIDYDESEVNKLIDNIALNIVLTSLKKEQRLDFYNYLKIDDYEKALLLINKEIPDFNNKLLQEVKKEFKKIL